MPQFKIAAVLALAIILQLTLGEAWPPLSHIDFPLIVVVYVALQRDAWTALIVGTIAGLAIDAPSGGLIGAGGFSKTLTAYLVYLGATRVNLENALIRIPVLAAATLVDGAVYFFWQRSLGHPPSAPFVQTISYNLNRHDGDWHLRSLHAEFGFQSDRNAEPAVRLTAPRRTAEHQFFEAKVKKSKP